ncbi:unnamed protein product [Tetraodon nigroviridis]|uniref:(spotted green pufferfish) hypothetical protein n=1 Tax=Tetraodon nigroviridis TaxID=99883 RepID=Q4SB20_TETNG|nr:unnamed protein product [Tetraodon nigroviridis]
MTAPAPSGRAGSAGSVGNSPTAAGRTPSGAAPELDFRSAARMEDLNRLIQEFSKHDQREYDDQRALEIHTAKDFIFSMLGKTRRGTADCQSGSEAAWAFRLSHSNGSGAARWGCSCSPLPVCQSGAEEAAVTGGVELQSRSPGGVDTAPPGRLAERTRGRRSLAVFVFQGWCRNWTRSSRWPTSTCCCRGAFARVWWTSRTWHELSVYARGTDYDMDFTLLVPALKLHDRNQPVTLDMRHSSLGHSWLSLRLFDEGTINKWKDCCTVVDHISGTTNYFFSPTLVADWFHQSISLVLLEVQKKPQRGMPRVEKVEKNGTVISVILGVGSSRMLYDIVPVVSFKGWPAVAQSWLMENHFWDGKITEEEVISGFYLLPACSFKGRKENEWRLSFARSEVQLKKCISSSLMGAYQACKAIIIKLLSRPKAVSPYHLRSIMLWACDRLPAAYLGQDDFSAHFLLGLIDDLQHCLVNKACPNYFIPQCNMLEHLSDEAAVLHARKLSSVRSDPAEHLRTTIEHAKAANRLTVDLQWRGSATQPLFAPSGPGGDSQPDDRLAKKLQQLVTENPGKSISVFINPDDVTRPHFRIDDKFF